MGCGHCDDSGLVNDGGRSSRVGCATPFQQAAEGLDHLARRRWARDLARGLQPKTRYQLDGPRDADDRHRVLRPCLGPLRPIHLSTVRKTLCPLHARYESLRASVSALRSRQVDSGVTVVTTRGAVRPVIVCVCGRHRRPQDHPVIMFRQAIDFLNATEQSDPRCDFRVASMKVDGEAFGHRIS